MASANKEVLINLYWPGWPWERKEGPNFRLPLRGRAPKISLVLDTKKPILGCIHLEMIYFALQIYDLGKTGRRWPSAFFFAGGSAKNRPHQFRRTKLAEAKDGREAN